MSGDRDTDASSASLAMPPQRLTAAGQPRLIGIEIELGGLTLGQAAGVLVDHLHGELSAAGRYETLVSGDPAGDWRVELDFELLKELGRRERGDADQDVPLESLIKDGIEQMLKRIAEPLVPVEIISPPLPLDRLGEVQSLIARLRDAGALGTGENPIHAFGLQLNPQPPALDAATLLRLFKAYLCLADWLRKRAQVDLTRRLTFFADPFPKDYVRATIAADYWPDQANFIDDYLRANPTRNRELDLLPLFAHLDAERVARVVTDERVKARPTFHYRLPNSEINQRDWGLHQAWNDWVAVERLAADSDRLVAICRAYRAHLDQSFSARLTGGPDAWARESEQWLTPPPDR